MKYLSVDRIEGTIAVCQQDDGTVLHIPLCDADSAFPIREGDVLRLTEDGTLIPDPQEKRRRLKAVSELLKRIKG